MVRFISLTAIGLLLVAVVPHDLDATPHMNPMVAEAGAVAHLRVDLLPSPTGPWDVLAWMPVTGRRTRARQPNPGGHPDSGWDPAPWIRGIRVRANEGDEFALLDRPPWYPHPLLTSTLLLLWVPALVIVIVTLMDRRWLEACVAGAALALIVGSAWRCLAAIGRNARHAEWFRNQPEGRGTYQSRPGEDGWYRNEPKGESKG